MPAGGPGGQLRHVLIVERDVIVGMGLADDLTELGFRVSGPFISGQDAIDVMAADLPDAVIVDLALRDGSGPEVARAAKGRDIPLVLFSAGGRRALVDGEFRDVPWVEKPASTVRLLQALALSDDPAGLR